MLSVRYLQSALICGSVFMRDCTKRPPRLVQVHSEVPRGLPSAAMRPHEPQCIRRFCALAHVGRLIDQVIHCPSMRTRSCGQGLLGHLDAQTFKLRSLSASKNNLQSSMAAVQDDQRTSDSCVNNHRAAIYSLLNPNYSPGALSSQNLGTR